LSNHRDIAHVRHGWDDLTVNSGPEKQLKIGILGCGAIAQAGHFESVTKARNTTLHAICDVAEDLLQRFSVTYGAARTYTQYERMLADPDLDAVIIATADAFHVPAALDALAAGKHVLCEKPLGIALDEVEELREAVRSSGCKLQVGHMKRFDPGIESARSFIDDEMGQMLAFKGWYCDSTHRYPMTDAVQPLIIRSAASQKPARDPKQDLQQYYMLAHGCHLVDMARFLCGDLVEVQARHLQRFGAHSWFVDVGFANGALGHLDLTVAVRMDWHEGFQLYGEHGSVLAKTFNPWLFRSSEVDIFRESTGGTSRLLGADGHFFRRQLESFADAILNDTPIVGADVEDGVASVRAMLAIAESARTGQPVKLADASGAI
jgi:predicted dehydrogenase|tara:strand:- start:1216 stop:2346 length:1131 start_codon:yes stop_codon:yes gene_type:complete